MANTEAIYISMNDRPRAVIEAMDGLQLARQAQAAKYSTRRRVPLLLFLTGVPFIVLDFVLGYNLLTCTLVGVGFWLAAFFVGRAMRRARPSGPPPPQFMTTRELLHTLRDDPDPRRGVFGHLDLTGARQPAKKFRDGSNVRGLAVEFYRDEWLNLRAKLYDGNMLRVSATERVKVRKSYYKRSAISGRNKLKPAKVASGQQIRVRLTVNPDVYEINEKRTGRPGTRLGKYTLAQLSASGGIVDLTAVSADSTVGAPDILAVLRTVYDQLSRKA